LRDVVFHKATLTNTSGVITGLVGAIMDITERKQAEQKVAERTELAETRSRQLQELTVELIKAEERERQRIAGLLHDDLQQLLAAARMQADVLIKKYPSEKIPETLKQLLNDSIENTRHLSYELSPPVLDHADLVGAIEWLVRRMHEQFELQVDLEIKKAAHIEINHPLKVFLFRRYRNYYSTLSNTVV
jgi:signal transduction histidine kinase